MDDKELQQKFLQFLAQKSGAKTQKDLEKYVQGLGEDGLKKAYEEFSKTLQEEETNKAKKAAHGMKLNYVKNLKNQCADDEELVYFKKGGTLGCGCRKKMQKGGETPKEENMISKFKKFRQKAENTANKLSGKTYTEGKTIILRKSDIEKAKKETEKQPNIDEEAVDMKPKKNCFGTKFRIHRQGGSLNGVPFYQEGGKNKKSINDYYLTDYSEPNIQQKAKLNGKELTIKVNKGQQKGEDPITIQGNNYYLKGDSTLVKDNSIPYTFQQLKNAGINKKYNGGSLNGVPFIRKENL